jgi:prepilin-type N-terminal cleavage/methylation domain-containing protein
MTSFRKVRAESGFTLIELIIATAISGLVMAGVAGMLSAVLVNAGATEARMTQTHDGQNAAAYFAQDVNAMGVRDWTDDTRPSQPSAEAGASYNGGRYPCGPAGTPNALIRMAWNDFDAASPTTVKRDVVAYVVNSTGPGGRLQLHRLLCQGGALRSDQVLVSSLSASPAASVVCTTPVPHPPGDPCAANPPPTGINLSLTVHDPKNKIPDYALTLSGHRMQT